MSRCGSPFFVPGHKRGAGASDALLQLLGSGGGVLACDLTELDGLDVLGDSQIHRRQNCAYDDDNDDDDGDVRRTNSGPSPSSSSVECLGEAQAQAAACFGARTSWFVVNGSTCGIHASVLATCGAGDALVMPRNAHQSAVYACALSGARPIYVRAAVNARGNFQLAHGVMPADVRRALDAADTAGVRVGAVLLVSPTYYGVTTDVAAVAVICHDRGVPLIVDEAHGSHFHFHAELPPSALACGADIVVQSTHKTLAAMTQCSLLHTRRGSAFADDELISRALTILQTSSPSYVLMASLDAARAQVHRAPRGAHPVAKAVELAKRARSGIARVTGIVILGPDHVQRTCAADTDLAAIGKRGAEAIIDVTRITVSVARLRAADGARLSGHAAAGLLRDRGVEPELSTAHCVVFVLTGGNTAEDVDALVGALRDIASSHVLDDAVVEDGLGCDGADRDAVVLSVMSPRDVMFDPRAVRFPLAQAVGRVCAELITVYPPGIPITTPGEIVTEAAVAQLRRCRDEMLTLGAAPTHATPRITGADDRQLLTLRCLPARESNP